MREALTNLYRTTDRCGEIRVAGRLRLSPKNIFKLSNLFGSAPRLQPCRAAPCPAVSRLRAWPAGAAELPGREALPRLAAFLEAVKWKAGVVECGALVRIGRPVRSWEAVRGPAPAGRAAVMPGARVLGACAQESGRPGMKATGRT